MPLGRSGRAPVDVRLPTGWPRTLKIAFPGLPSRAFSIFEMIAVVALLELAGFCAFDELVGFGEPEELVIVAELDTSAGSVPLLLDDDCGVALEDDSAAVQFSPMQNVSVSPGFPMSVIFRHVLEPLYQRMAGYLSSENSE